MIAPGILIHLVFYGFTANGHFNDDVDIFWWVVPDWNGFNAPLIFLVRRNLVYAVCISISKAGLS